MTHPTPRHTLAALATSAVLFLATLGLLGAQSSAGVPW